jgi:hypothetical protein
MVLRTAAAALMAAALAAGGAPAQTPPSAESFYLAAVRAMRDLPQPRYLTYDMHGEGDGLDVGLTVIRHLVWLAIRSGSGSASWQLRHRTDDYATEIVDDTGRRYVTQRSFFDPTWYGAYRALRDGMLDYQDVEKPLSMQATPAAQQSPDLRTIAVVNVIGTSIYRVEDAGPAACSDGAPGHRIHLISRDRNPKHQLDDVIVELSSMRFCMIRYRVRDAFGFNGFVEQRYGDVGGYWLQTGGTLDGTQRAFGIAVHGGIWRYRLTNVEFPRSLPASAFQRPEDQ